MNSPPRGLEGALGGIQVGQLAQQVSKAAQHGSRDAVARRHGFIAEGLAAVNELLMILRGEEKSAAIGIFELIEQHVCQLARECQVAAAPTGLQQLQQGIRQEGVVIEIRGQVRAAILVSREQAAVAPQIVMHEVNGGAGGHGQLRPPQHARRNRQSLDHERIPGREDFLIARRPHSQIARFQQLRARRLHPGVDGFRGLAEQGGNIVNRRKGVQMPFTLEVGGAIQAESR